MVRCLKCMNALPRECVCLDLWESKIDRYLREAGRELELVKAIQHGFKPKISIGNQSLNKISIKVHNHYSVSIRISSYMNDWRKFRKITLYGKDEKPLYRYDCQDHIKARKGDIVDIEWQLGIE